MEGRQELFILNCHQSVTGGTEIMKFVFNEQRNKILEQNSEEGREWGGEEQEL